MNERIEWCKNELRQRVGHLKEKYAQLLNSGNNTLFLIKVMPTDYREDREYIRAVYKALNDTYVSGMFTLIVILPKSKMMPELRDLEDDNIRIRAVRWFPPQKHTDIASDSRGWGNIFKEFFNVSEKEYYKRERKQRRRIIPGMIIHRIKRTFVR